MKEIKKVWLETEMGNIYTEDVSAKLSEKFRQVLIRVVKETAEAGKVEKKMLKASFETRNTDELMEIGFNQAVFQQQTQLKEFLKDL